MSVPGSRSGDAGGENIAVIIPAKDEGDRITATVRAALGIAKVDLALVVDDGSSDHTATAAAEAGARVVRHSRNWGKGAAMETGAESLRLLEESEELAEERPRHLLFLDADLAESAVDAAPLVDPVRAGTADMTIALFPATRPRGGGHGFVVRLARDGILRTTGWHASQPLNGQRCVTRAAFEAARPLARGFGVETALTIDLLRQGFRVMEIETPLSHRATGTDLRAQLHRARQFVDVGRALAARELGPAAGRRVRRLDAGARATSRSIARRITRNR